LAWGPEGRSKAQAQRRTHGVLGAVPLQGDRCAKPRKPEACGQGATGEARRSQEVEVNAI